MSEPKKVVIDVRDDSLLKRILVVRAEDGGIEVSYTDGSDSGEASFAPCSKIVNEYVSTLRESIFHDAAMKTPARPA